MGTLPMSHFFQKFPLEENRKKCKKVEELINRYSIDLYEYNTSDEEYLIDEKNYFLLRNDFDDLINSIHRTFISRNYLGLFSWLIDRAFLITPQTKGKSSKIQATINKNKSILIKVLYDVNRSNLLKCFSKNT